VTVSVVKYDGSLDSIGRAIELCGGFEKLDRNHSVLIKPNITFSGWMPIPPYGMVTTSRMIEGILRQLSEFGCRDITVGEGTVAEVLGSHTRGGYRYTGIDRIARRYGARLVDLNDGPFESRKLGEVKVKVAKAVLDSDFMINVPVLKTHRQTKISLGFKNLKGCVDIPSRKRFHHRGLDQLICLLNQLIVPDLTVIDGIYMLEKGADTLMGTAYRKDLIIAGHDAFDCDCIGAAIMGIDPSEVGHLNEYAQASGRSTDVSAIPITGEDIKPLKERLEWEFDAKDELLNFGITGISVPYPGQNLCSGCYGSLICALGVFAKANTDCDFGDARIYWGRQEEAGGEKIILFGDCGISGNKNREADARIKGCPPSMMDTLLTLMRTLLSKPRMARMLLWGSPQLLALRTGLYSGNLKKWERYRSREFDSSHFRPPRWRGIAGALRNTQD
jgi:uncharacterized protein (DUF362 family)